MTEPYRSSIRELADEIVSEARYGNMTIDECAQIIDEWLEFHNNQIVGVSDERDS